MEEVRQTLLAFIQAVQKEAQQPDGRFLFHLRNHVDGPTVSFGFGYFDRDKCYVTNPGPHQGQITNEQAVELLTATYG